MRSKARAGGWLVAAVLISSWALSSASDQAPPERPPVPVLTRSPLSDVSGAVNAEIDRLVSRTWQPAPPIAPSRNPFSFAPRQRVERAGPVGEIPAPQPNQVAQSDARPVPPPSPRLSGIVDAGQGTLTAVITFLDDLHFAKKGDVIAGRFRVDAITIEGAEVFDLAAGMILRLSIQRSR